MGRPRTPSVLKELKGTAQPCRMNPLEPTLPTSAPEMPTDFSVAEQAVWLVYIHTLDRMKVLTFADRRGLIQLTQATALYDLMKKYLDANGHTYVADQREGAVHRMRPEYQIMQDAEKRIQFWLSRFGLTPADRSRVSATAPTKNTDERTARYTINKTDV